MPTDVVRLLLGSREGPACSASQPLALHVCTMGVWYQRIPLFLCVCC
jgi:hypothetical protein